MPLPCQSHERSCEPTVQCTRRKWRNARRLDRSIKRFMVTGESFVVRTVSWFVNVENGDHEARPIMVPSHTAGRLNVFRACLRLAEHHHQAKSRDVQTNGDHVCRNSNINMFLSVERL